MPNYRHKDVSEAIRQGEKVSKQVKIWTDPTKTMKTVEKAEKFINQVIKEQRPPARAGMKIEAQVVLRYYNAEIDNGEGREKGAKIDMKNQFTRKPFEFDQLAELNVQGHDDSFNDYSFGWSIMRDTMKLHRSFYILYRYVAGEGGKSEDNNCLRDELAERFGWTEEEIDKYKTIVKDGHCARVSKLGDIEYYMKVNINVADYFKSPMLQPLYKTINLTLYNQHYESTEPKPRVIEREDLKHFANRRIVLYNASDKKVKTIQKTKEGFLIEETDDKKEIDELQRRQIKHVIWLCNVHREPTEELWNQFNVFEQYCRNEFKTSFTQYESLPHFAVALWKSTLPAISLTSPTVYDDFMLDDIMHSGGALVDFVEGEYENATAYDYVSFYPSLNLGNVPRMMPYYGEPSYKYMKPCNDEEKEKYGLDFFVQMKQGWFDVIIEDKELKKETPRRFMKSHSGYYYSDEIQMMQNKRYKF